METVLEVIAGYLDWCKKKYVRILKMEREKGESFFMEISDVLK